MSSSKRVTSVVIDPVAMNIVNRVALGSWLEGQNTVEGGILIEGIVGGRTTINSGPLVLMGKATLSGEITVNGDAYIFGQVGTKGDVLTNLIVHGVLHLTGKCVVYGHIKYAKVAMYEGAVIHGAIEPLPDANADTPT